MADNQTGRAVVVRLVPCDQPGAAPCCVRAGAGREVPLLRPVWEQLGCTLLANQPMYGTLLLAPGVQLAEVIRHSAALLAGNPKVRTNSWRC